jgi:hypothetical protein
MGKAKLKASPAATGQPVAANQFKADGVVYEFAIARFILDGRTYSAEQAARMPGVCAKLVSMKSGAIRKSK